MSYKLRKRLWSKERREQLKHNPAFHIYTNFNALDRIDRSLTEIATATRQRAQISFFESLWVHILQSAWVVREEVAWSKRPSSETRERAGGISDSETFVTFVKESANEMLCDILDKELVT